MLRSRLTVGVIPGLLFSLYLLVIYIPDIKATLGATCTDDCEGTNEICQSENGICVCEEGFYDSDGTAPGGTCNPKLDLGSTCPTLVGEKVCKDTNAECSGGKCVCGSNYYDDNGVTTSAGTCLLKLDLGSNCSTLYGDKVCNDSNAECSGGKCVCSSNYYDDNGATTSAGTCRLKLDLGSNCPTLAGEKVCNDSNAECSGGKCVCSSNYYDDNGATTSAGTCRLKLDLGSNCSTLAGEKVCNDSNAECSGGKCVCSSNYYDDNGATTSAGTCRLKLDLGSDCSTLAGEKVCNDSNAECSGGKCVCGSNYYDDNGATTSAGTCRLKRDLGSTCPTLAGEKVCNDSNAECRGGKCVCSSNYYDDNGATTSAGTCRLKLDLGSTCPTLVGEKVCKDTNAECSGGKCECGSNYYDDNGATTSAGTCRLKRDLGSTCPTLVGEKVCNDSNAECSNGKCVCSSNYYDDNGATTSAGTCRLKLDLGSNCPTLVGEKVCNDSNAECRGGKCVCGSNYYDDNGALLAGTCRLTTNLRVKSPVYGTITENTIQISWTPPDDITAVSYYRVAYGPADTTTVVNQKNVGTQTSFVLNSLDPGKKYSISVFSVNNQTDLTERSTSVTQNQTTKPSIPGALLKDMDIDASSGNITLQWNSSIGVVTGYFGSLENKTTLFIYNKTFNISGITSNPTSFSDVKNGTWYNFTVQAVVGYADTMPLYSGIHSQLINTKVQVPNPPTNLSCFNATDRAITLKWMQPEFPNGDIISYIIVINRTQPSQEPYKVTSQGTNVQYTVNGLTEGSFYTFQVYTVNELYTSTSFAEATSCLTKPKMAQPPEDLVITNETSRSGIVTWKKPNNLNGTLYGYSLQILNDSSCVREVIWKCTDCQGAFPNLTTSCLNASKLTANSTALLGPQYYAAEALFPATNYAVNVAAITGIGTGDIASKNLPTKEEAPLKPLILLVRNITAKTATVEWSMDEVRPGQTTYIITATGISPAETRNHSVSEFFNRKYDFTDLEEYWNYSVIVQATTSIGSNQSDPYNFATLPGPAGNVSLFSISKGTGDDEYVTAVVSWRLPLVLDRNGPIDKFYVQQNEGNNPSISKMLSVQSDETYTANFSVVPERNYTFMVRAANDHFNGTVNTLEYFAPAGQLDLGSNCSTLDGVKVCNDSNAECSGGKCVCGSNYYDDNNATTSAGTCRLTTNLRVKSLGYGTIMENMIQISWKPPDDITAVSYYRVTYGSADNTTVVNQKNVGNQTSFVLNSLDPGKKYSISVFSVNNQTDITERSTSVTQNQTTKPSIPGALLKDMDIDASSGNITLQWNSSIGEVTGYFGSLENKTTLFIYNKTFNISGITSNQTSFSGVKNGTLYNFTIQAVVGYADTMPLSSEIHSQLIKTKVQVPNPPTNLSCLDPTDNTISLKWIQPLLPNGDIISYIIVINRTQPSQEPYKVTSQGTNVQYTVNGLTEGSFYTFQVYTVNENHTSTSFAEATLCATKAKMAQPPEDLVITNETSRSGIVTWKKPNNLNGTLNGYSLQILNDSSCVREVIWKCTDCQGAFPNLTTSCLNASQLTANSSALLDPQYYEAVALFPGTNYTVNVAAITGNGTGNSASKNLSTKEEAPLKPLIVLVRNITAKTATVEWSMDEVRPGQTNYVITATGISPAETRNHSVSGFFSRKYEFIDLEEYWNYSLIVQATTSIGSNQSDTYNFTTLAGPAGNVSLFSISKGTGDDEYVTAVVSWRLPLVLDRNGPIDKFYVQQNEGNNPSISKLLSVQSDETYTANFSVVPERNYTFMVRAANDHFNGTVNTLEYFAPAGQLDLGSNCSTLDGEKVCKDANAACSNGRCVCGSNYYDDNGATTSAGTCRLTTNLRVKSLGYGTITENTIQISWKPPDDITAVSYYRVTYGSADNTTVVNQKNVGNQTSFVLNSLDPGKKYSISVFSVNNQTDITERSTSVTQNQTTKPSIPGALLKDMDIDASSGSITLQWNSSIGVVTGYFGSLENKTTLFIYNKTFNTFGITPTQTFLDVKNGTWYNFTVQAVVGYADTMPLYSEIHSQLIKTKVQVPNPPTNLSCFNATDRAITLKWMQPEFPNGDIISYIIVINRTQPSQEPYKVTSQGTNVQYTVNGLTEGSFYTFQVYTVNELYTSTSFAEATSCVTKPKTTGNISRPVVRPEIRQISSDKNQLVFYCDIDPLSDISMLYQVTWYRGILGTGSQLKSSTYIPYNSREIFRSLTYLSEAHITLGMTIFCSIYATKMNITTTSEPYFVGFEMTSNNSLKLQYSEEALVSIRLTVPFGCQRQNEECFLGVNMFYMETGADNCLLPVAAALSSCGVRISSWRWNQSYAVRLANKHGQNLHSISRTYNIRFKTDARFDHDFFRNYTLPRDIQVEATSNSSSLNGKECHAICDPHMQTFDGRYYENQNEGTYILYKHLKIPIQVQMRTNPCYGFKEGPPFCPCGVAIAAGRDVFVVDRCSIPIKIYMPQCDEGILQGKIKSDGNIYQVHLPSGSWVIITSGISFNIYIYPSLSDHMTTSGLCGYLDSEIQNDFMLRNRTTVPEIKFEDFNSNWLVKPEEDLFNTSNYLYLPGWPREDYFCICEEYLNGYVFRPDNCSPDSRKFCPESTLNDSLAADCSRKLSTNVSVSVQLDPSDFNVSQSRNDTTMPKRNFTEASANNECWSYLNSSLLFKKCSELPDIVPESFANTCTKDALITETMFWASTHLDNAQKKCIYQVTVNQPLSEQVIKENNVTLNPDEPDTNKTTNETVYTSALLQELKDISCPMNCSDHGICRKGQCICWKGYDGNDCSIDLSKAPDVYGIPNRGVCDLHKMSCDHASILGYPFADSQYLSCRLSLFQVKKNERTFHDNNSIILKAKWISFAEISCPIADVRSKRSVEFPDDLDTLAIGYSVAVGNNRELFGRNVSLLILDSLCVDCIKAGFDIACTLKDGFNLVNRRCIKKKDPEKETNSGSTILIISTVVGSVLAVIVIGVTFHYCLILRKRDKYDKERKETAYEDMQEMEDPKETYSNIEEVYDQITDVSDDYLNAQKTIRMADKPEDGEGSYDKLGNAETNVSEGYVYLDTLTTAEFWNRS